MGLTLFYIIFLDIVHTQFEYYYILIPSMLIT